MSSPDRFHLNRRPEIAEGRWADHAVVYSRPWSVTIDFARADPEREGMSILVARITCAPEVVGALLEGLEVFWSEYTRNVIPKEVYGDEHE